MSSGILRDTRLSFFQQSCKLSPELLLDIMPFFAVDEVGNPIRAYCKLSVARQNVAETHTCQSYSRPDTVHAFLALLEQHALWFLILPRRCDQLLGRTLTRCGL